MDDGDIGQHTTITKVIKEKRYRNYNWTDAEVHALMKAWWDHHKDFRSTKRGCSRRPLYDKISFDIRRYGYQRSRAEAQTKLQNLLKIYRKERERLKQTGEKGSKWKYYNIVKHIVDVDSQEMENPFDDYLSSDPDSREMEADAGSSNAHIIKLTNSLGSDSDTPDGSFNYYTDSQDSPKKQHLPFHSSPPKKKQSNIENVLSAFLSEFKRSNAELEKNDQKIMGLLKENNELCKRQIELLTLFVNK